MKVISYLSKTYHHKYVLKCIGAVGSKLATISKIYVSYFNNVYDIWYITTEDVNNCENLRKICHLHCELSDHVKNELLDICIFYEKEEHDYERKILVYQKENGV